MPVEQPSDNEGGIEVLEVEHHYVGSRDVVAALAPVSLTIPVGQFVCVVGPSGCGKSTLLNILAGFMKPSGGRVLVDGRQVDGPSPSRGVVFQRPNLYPWFDVLDNVSLGLRFAGQPKAARDEVARRHLETVGLGDFAHRRPYELSGGMQQRAQIARVMATDPEIMLMDEPFGALDALTREKLQYDLLDLSRARRTTVFFITHSVDEAIILGDRVLVMSPRPGRVVLDVPIDISQQHGEVLSGDALRHTAEFQELRDLISNAIQVTR